MAQARCILQVDVCMAAVCSPCDPGVSIWGLARRALVMGAARRRWMGARLRAQQTGEGGERMLRREENSVRVTNLSEDSREDDLRVRRLDQLSRTSTRSQNVKMEPARAACQCELEGRSQSALPGAAWQHYCQTWQSSV